MIFSNDRTQLRKMYMQAWQRYQSNQTLSPLEKQIVTVIQDHPEYQSAIENECHADKDYFPEMGETNPFLHMGLHLALREQLATDRPNGIKQVYETLLNTAASHDVEHQMIDTLAETLWQSQRANMPPDETAYLEKLQRLTKRHMR